ncbi:hypothetical protein OG21DRAFT_1383144, partial [Imleria badia]
IKPMNTHCFLGILLDEELRWNKHATYTLGKGTAYVLQLCCVLSSSKGISLILTRQLYTVVALPKMLYTINLWLKPIYTGDSDEINWGSIGTTKQLCRIQRLTAIAITSTFKTTATDTVEAHTKLIPL